MMFGMGTNNKIKISSFLKVDFEDKTFSDESIDKYKEIFIV